MSHCLKKDNSSNNSHHHHHHHADMVSEFKNKKPGMMILIGLAVTVAYVYSAVVVFGVPGKVFFTRVS